MFLISQVLISTLSVIHCLTSTKFTTSYVCIFDDYCCILYALLSEFNCSSQVSTGCIKKRNTTPADPSSYEIIVNTSM